MSEYGYTDEAILSVLLGEATDEAKASLESACLTDPRLRVRCDRLAGTLHGLGLARDIDPLFEVDRARLTALASGTLPKPGVRSAAASGLRRLVAAVVSDSGLSAVALAGFRSGTGDRQVVFQADEAKVTLRVSVRRPVIEGVTAGEILVVGRVEGVEGLTGAVTQDPSGHAARATVDSQGFFEFAGLPGTWRLELVGTGVAIEIPAVELAA